MMDKCLGKDCEKEFDRMELIGFEKDKDVDVIRNYLSNEYKVSSGSVDLIEKRGCYDISISETYLTNLSATKLDDSINEKIEKENTHLGIEIKGWKVLLQVNPTEYFYENFIKKGCVLRHFHHNDKMHRGHLLANWFIDYLKIKKIKKLSIFLDEVM